MKERGQPASMLVSRARMTAAWRTLGVAAVAVFVVSLDSTVLFVAFPSLRRAFSNVTPEGLSWVINVYTIGYGALLVPSGRLADRFGRRRFFSLGLTLFIVASLLCGLAPDVTSLIIARGLQSVGGAMLMPASFALVLHAFPKERRGVAVGIWGAVGALAAAVGPAIGSAVVQFASWRWAFFLNVPVGAYVLARGARRLEESHGNVERGLPDAVGTILLVAALGTLAFAVVSGRSRPTTALWTGLAGFVLAGFFIVRSMSARTPALDLSLFRLRSFAVANAMTLVFSVGFTAMFLGNVLFLTDRWGLSTFEAGLWLSPGPLLVGPSAVLSGRRADRFGYRSILIVGGLLYALAALWFIWLARGDRDFLRWLSGSVVIGIAIGMILPSLGGASTSELTPDAFGVGSGVNQAVRQFGSVLGVAVVIFLLGGLGRAAPFGDVYWLLVATGLLTSIGGAVFPTGHRSVKGA